MRFFREPMPYEIELSSAWVVEPSDDKSWRRLVALAILALAMLAPGRWWHPGATERSLWPCTPGQIRFDQESGALLHCVPTATWEPRDR